MAPPVRATVGATVTPPVSSSAAVMPPRLRMPAVSWPAAETRTTPAFTLNWPVQPVLGAPKISVPTPSLVRLAAAFTLAAPSPKAVPIVSVFPATTSSVRVSVVLPKTSERLKVMSSSTRKRALPPAAGVRTTLLAAAPRTAEAETARPPRWTTTSPTKSLVMLLMTSTPSPVLVRPVPDSLPRSSSPETVFGWE